jgi:hypothetical protein
MSSKVTSKPSASNAKWMKNGISILEMDTILMISKNGMKRVNKILIREEAYDYEKTAH